MSEHVGLIDEHAALVVLLRSRPDRMGWSEIATRVLECGSAVQLRDELLGADLLPSPEDSAARNDLERWTVDGARFVSILDDDFPARLRGIHDAPPFLVLRGAADPVDIGVSVVGSRGASDRGLQMAAAIARTLVDIGVSVISGLAAGIDAAAHTACLEAGGRPVGIIGTGINRQYPAANRQLHARVAAKGLLISQFWPDQPPQKHTFPMRNATMSGYGIATIVVEAGEHSGARIQARLAVEHGRPVLLSESVIDNNAWAQVLVGRPGVHAVASIAQVREIVTALVDEPERVDDALNSLLTA